MTEVNIDVSQLITVLNNQLAESNLQLQIAKLQVDALRKILEEHDHDHLGTTAKDF